MYASISRYTEMGSRTVIRQNHITESEHFQPTRNKEKTI